MRYFLIIAAVCSVFATCKKDKFTTVPQIKYKSIKPNAAQSNIPVTSQVIPVLTIHVTDAEGDLGFASSTDVSYIIIKNLLTGKLDSLRFPDIQTSARKNFEGDVEITLTNFLGSSTRPRPKTDTLYFEVYLKDFAKNKSNVIRTDDPVFYITP